MRTIGGNTSTLSTEEAEALPEAELRERFWAILIDLQLMSDAVKRLYAAAAPNRS
jgi:hypothetical protein